MTRVIIHESGAYRLTSFGNGLAYALERLADAASIFVQGDDAESFRQTFEELCESEPSTDAACDGLFWAYH